MGNSYINCANCCDIFYDHYSTSCPKDGCYSFYCPDCKNNVYKNDCGKCTKNVKLMILSLEEKYNFILKHYNIDDEFVIKTIKKAKKITK